MRLSRLEIRGFKSFAQPAILEFGPGITAIVGPNGSGKSNVADAIRWSLGEQSLKNLRSKRLEEMIFSGSANRNSLGMAEVSLTLDNGDGRLGIDHSEVMITRRAYRSGESEYRLNRDKVRHRDLIELLQSASVSLNGFTIVSQGMVDEALSLRSTERRQLLEEAADVRRFRARIVEAKDRLLTTQQNMLRVRDLLGEIKPRLDQLSGQSKKLVVYEDLSAGLGKARTEWYAIQWVVAKRLLSETQADEAVLSSIVEALRAKATGLRNQLDSVSARRAQLELDIKSIQDRLGQARGQRETARRELAVIAERSLLNTRQMEELKTETAAMGSELARNRAQAEDLRAKLDAALEEARGYSDRLTESEKALAKARGRATTLRQSVRDQQQRSFAAASRSADLRNRQSSTQDRLRELATEVKRNRGRIDEIGVKVGDVEGQLKGVKDRQTQLSEEMVALEQQVQGFEAQTRELRAKESTLTKAMEELRQSAAQLHTRLDVMRRLRESGSGYYAGVKAVIEASKQAGSKKRLAGVVGTIAELVRVPGHLEVAIEIALGSHLQDIVVEKWEHAEEAIRLLKETHQGRATFLPLDTVGARHRDGVPTDALARGWWTETSSSVLGVASALVSADAQLSGVVEYLLGRILIVKDLDTARGLLRRCPPGWIMVTLAGDLVRPGGAVTGGSIAKHGTVGFLTRERELRELPNKVAEVEARMSETETEMKSVRASIARTSEQREKTIGLLQNAKRRADDLASAARTHEQERESLRREAAWWTSGLDKLLADEKTLNDKLQTIAKDLAASDKEQTDGSSRLSDLASELASLEEAEGGLSKSHTDLAQLVARVQGEAKSAADLLESRLKSVEAGERLLAAKNQRIGVLEAELAEGQRDAAVLNELLSEADKELRGLGEQESALTALGQSVSSELTALNESDAALRLELNQAEARMQESLVKGAKRSDAVLHLEQMARNDGVELGQMDLDGELAGLADSEEAVNAARQTMDDFRLKLRQLGPVNHQAASEYADVKERHDTLESQLNDLDVASESLGKLIAELEQMAKTRFADTFKVVAEDFSKYFTSLFGGGSAKLVMSKEGDGAEPGIDIVAQPPGKRPSGLGLLSGGERALTAVALLFAVLESVDTPFVVLDEVDAALDDANVSRFCGALTRLARRKQFVVITHNRGTMDAAGTLYGVSMEDSATSRVYSMRKAEEYVAV